MHLGYLYKVVNFTIFEHEFIYSMRNEGFFLCHLGIPNYDRPGLHRQEHDSVFRLLERIVDFPDLRKTFVSNYPAKSGAIIRKKYAIYTQYKLFLFTYFCDGYAYCVGRGPKIRWTESIGIGCTIFLCALLSVLLCNNQWLY